MTDERLQVDATRDGDTVVLALTGDLDLTSADKVDAATTAAVGEGVATLRFDLGGVEFADSTGLGALVKAHRAATDAGAQMECSHVPAQLRRLMEITKLDELFTVID